MEYNDAHDQITHTILSMNSKPYMITSGLKIEGAMQKL